MPDDDEDQERWVAQLQHLEDQVLSWAGNRLGVLVLTLSGLDKAVARDEPVLDSLREEGIGLHGPNFELVVTARARR